MSDIEEQNEGRKDARVDRANNKNKRSLNTYAPSYQDGYNEVWTETKIKPKIPEKNKDVE